jgi:hypothetical protein
VYNKNKPADKTAKSKDPQLAAFVVKSVPHLIAQGYTREAAGKKAAQMYKEQQSKAKSPKTVASPANTLAKTRTTRSVCATTPATTPTTTLVTIPAGCKRVKKTFPLTSTFQQEIDRARSDMEAHAAQLKEQKAGQKRKQR